MGKNNCNSITIAKAIGIILMVVGHSGCPQMLSKFIYLFHMPLFFLCLLGYDMDVSHIAEHPVIASIHTPSYMWIVYSIVGVCAPIVLVIFYLFICNSFKKID
jgi:predicted tellurium resistance membrane protein TerC